MYVPECIRRGEWVHVATLMRALESRYWMLYVHVVGRHGDGGGLLPRLLS